jgi:hypothetical protein
VCLNDHSHYLNFRPGFRSLGCFLARACHDLIWIAIVAFDPPSLSSASYIFQNPPNSAPTQLDGTACQATLSLSHPHSLPCLYSIVAFHRHQSLKSRIACIEHSLEPNIQPEDEKSYDSRSNLFGTPSCTVCRIQPQNIARVKGKRTHNLLKGTDQSHPRETVGFLRGQKILPVRLREQSFVEKKRRTRNKSHIKGDLHWNKIARSVNLSITCFIIIRPAHSLRPPITLRPEAQPHEPAIPKPRCHSC